MSILILVIGGIRKWGKKECKTKPEAATVAVAAAARQLMTRITHEIKIIDKAGWDGKLALCIKRPNNVRAF